MTSVTASTATPGATANAASASANTPSIDPNSFLKMLVAELQYQDPTKPMDTSQLVSQLSAMSQVEQAAQTNSKLSSILDQLAVGQSSTLIGLTATSADGTQSGTIEAVRVTATGSLATLSDGSQLLLAQGVVLSS